MKIDDYLKLHRMICDGAREISKCKGHDYSGDEDNLANLKRTAALGICSPETGVLVRLGDKLSRLSSLLASDRKPLVNDETIMDTIIDGVNYLILLYALIAEQASGVRGPLVEAGNDEPDQAPEIP